MRRNYALLRSRVPVFFRTLARPLFRRPLQRRVLCCAVTLNLLLWPGLGLVTEHVIGLAEYVLNSRIGSHSYEAYFLGRLFSQSNSRPRRETMAERASAIAHIQINPIKLVGYENDGATFTASPSDFLDRTIQGVKFSWESSNTTNLQIDDAGRARFLHPGLVKITCRAGAASVSAPVLIRPNRRPRQSDAEWRIDQQRLSINGDILGETDGRKGIGSALASLVDKLAPTAVAQGPPYPDDLGYDQLWSEPRNLAGAPRHVAATPMPLGSVLPEGSNFKWAVPMISLGGRGLAANLTLHYNSRVWSRRNNQVAFDAITGSPAPGYSLGFGRIVFYDAGFGYNPIGKFLWIEPDGTRHYLGTGTYMGDGYALGGPYETSDGSHIVYVGNAQNGGTLSYPDGTTVSITSVNNRLLPTTINDRNGNYIQIAYKPDCFQVGNEMFCGYFSPIALDYVIDTLGRRIECQYDSSYRLISITSPGFGGTTQNPVTNTLVQFDYQTVTPIYSFSGLTVERAPWTALRLKHIYFPATSTGYLPAYSQYGMVSSVSVRRQMTVSTWPPGSPPSIGDGVESAAVSFNYPASGSLTDCPAFTQRTDTAVNSPTSVYSYSTSTNTIAQTMTFTITRPDSTTVLLTRSTNTSSPANGRLVQSEVKNGSASLAKTVLSYVNDGGGSPQVQSVTSYDDTNMAVKVDFDYDAKANITNKREYGFQVSGAWQVRRRTHTTYTTIAAAVNLPTEVDLYDALGNTNDADDVMIAKATYAYDNYVSMGGMDDYGGTASPPGHLSWFGTGYTTRGNVTGVTQWTDLIGGTTIQHLAKYDIFGNVVKAQVSCCQEKDLTNTQDTYWGLTEIETSGDPNGAHQTTSTDYDFNTSLPTTVTDAGGLITNIGYDAALNPVSVTLPTGASAAAGFDYGNLSSTKTVTYSDTGFDGGVYGPVTRTLTTTTNYDGWGRVIQTISPNSAQVNASYDAMGRVVSRTNPFTAGGTPGPATTIQYDPANKAMITTLPGGNTVRSDYSGAMVTATDQVNRKIKRESDGLGRLIKVTEQDVSTGTLTQRTSYSYNLLDNLTQVNQGGQYRSYKYDSMGRLLYERIPEQTATINDGTGANWTTAYSYTEFSSLKKKTDARGVETHNSFDELHRVTQTWYTGVGGDDSGGTRPALPSGVAATGDQVMGYTSSGAISSVNIYNPNGVGYAYTESYTFDGNLRPASVTRYLLDPANDTRKTYTTSYEYNGGSQLSKIIYPSGQQKSVNHDDKGRAQSLTYDPGDTSGYLTGMGYNIAGEIIGLTLGNGVAETYAYDTNRLQLATQTATKGATSLINLSYSYQASAGQMGVGSTVGNAGHLMSITGTINSTTESSAYTYDDLGRLVTSDQAANGSSAQRTFEYDRWGNRTAFYDGLPGGKTPPPLIQRIQLQQSGAAPTNRITSVTNSGSTVNYTYDAAGKVTNDGVHTYVYDAANRVVSVDNGATAQYRYDHQSRRVCKITGSICTHYIWQGTQVIGQHDATTAYTTNPTYQVNSARTDYIYSGSRMISSRERASSGGTWTRKYYLSDRLNARLILDTNGNVLGRQAHLPFGEDFGESGTQEKHHFTSYERDGEVGTDYAVNRQYSQSTGRFNRSDPLASSGKRESPQTWNRYSYATSDPINMTDPLGLFFGTGEEPDLCAYGAGATITVDGMPFDPDLMCIEFAGPELGSPDPDPIEPSPRCNIGISGRGSITTGVPLQFPDGTRNRGFTKLSYPPMGLAPVPGWFWNIEIFASVTDDVANWTVHQEILATMTGSRYEGGVRRTEPAQLDYPVDLPTGARLVQNPGEQWLFWIDAPGLRFREGIEPENMELLLQGKSWITQGKAKCEVVWTLKLVWRNRRIDLSQSEFRSERERF
jgi:RHS repeat-associated protein